MAPDESPIDYFDHVRLGPWVACPRCGMAPYDSPIDYFDHVRLGPWVACPRCGMAPYDSPIDYFDHVGLGRWWPALRAEWLRSSRIPASPRRARSRKAAAPSAGPISVPMPPRITITMISPDRVQCMKAGLTYFVKFTSRTPATPHMAPAKTKAASL